MKKLGLALLFLFNTCLPSWALLDDTEAQAATRYGQAISHSANPQSDKQTKVYEYQGYRVIVTFEQGRSTSEGFFSLKGATAFSDETIKELLQEHAAGQSWRELPTPNGVRLWIRPGAVATYGEEDHKAQFAVMAYAGSPDAIIQAATSRALNTTPQ